MRLTILLNPQKRSSSASRVRSFGTVLFHLCLGQFPSRLPSAAGDVNERHEESKQQCHETEGESSDRLCGESVPVLASIRVDRPREHDQQKGRRNVLEYELDKM